MLDLRDYYKKIKKYKLIKIFHYSDTSKIRIFFNILRLIYYQIINKRLIRAKVNNYKMILDLKTLGLSKALFVYGKREILDTYLVNKNIKEDINVLDIGANIGYYVLMEASQLRNGKIYALEPDPRNIELLRKNIELNNFQNKVKILPLAASDKNEIKAFHLGERTNVSSFLDRNDVVNTINVKCVKLDDLPFINDIDFIRMDIEGYEVKVLEGARNFLTTTQKPIKILIEVHNFAYNKDDFNFKYQLEYLNKHGFEVKYLISGDNNFSKVFSKMGYEAIKNGIETNIRRSLYKNIKFNDFVFLLEKKLIRSLMIEKIRF